VSSSGNGVPAYYRLVCSASVEWRQRKVLHRPWWVLIDQSASTSTSPRESDNVASRLDSVTQQTSSTVTLTIHMHIAQCCNHCCKCCKDDCESLWKSLKFDPSPRKNGSTNRPPNLHRWLRPGYLPSAKFCADRTRGFSPHMIKFKMADMLDYLKPDYWPVSDFLVLIFHLYDVKIWLTPK